MAGHVWRFADCEFDEARYELRVAGSLVDIEVKPLEVLRALLLQAGEVVTKDELLEAVWPGTSVVDGSLATAVSKLRKAVGSPSLIVTVPRVGYRLAVPVTRRERADPAWPSLHLEPGALVPGREQWRLERHIGVSPSSEVWLAVHPKTAERRVFKFATDPVHLRGLKREVTVARLIREALGERPEFVRLLEWNFETGPAFLESEYGGLDLAAWASARGGLSTIDLAVRVGLIADAAAAVHEVHGIDVLHKDLKPGNLLVSEAETGGLRVAVTDFGSASIVESVRLDALGITRLGFTDPAGSSDGAAGTASYVAPELLSGSTPTRASDVYALGVLLYQVVVGDFRRVPAPGWEADVADPLLRADIAAAASGDPERRLQSAGELAHRLRNLDVRRARHASAAGASGHPARAAEARSSGRPSRAVAWLAAAALALVAAGAWVFMRQPATPASLPTIAVMPFENSRGDAALDYLRIALADEAVTILSRMRGVAARPLPSETGRPGGADASAIATQLGADTFLTGHFYAAGGRLTLTLQAFDTRSNQLLWRDSLDAPADNLVSAQVQMALRLRGGLAPALGASQDQAGPEPTNAEAYALFLRSVALPLDPDRNHDGIAALERSLALDERYAPAWQALSRRYYVNARYGQGNPVDIERAEAAAKRAVTLDADFVAPAAGLVVYQVERGDLAGAYARASRLVERRADSVDALFALSYVLRFAGRLDEAATHCERAFLLDRRNATSGLRSCAVVFLLLGDYTRASNYLHLDEGSEWQKALTIHMLLRQNKIADALALGEPNVPQWTTYPLLRACASGLPAAEVANLAANVTPSTDPETNFFAAAHLSYCGDVARAEALLSQAIAGGYCSAPAIETDPFFAKLRESGSYAAVLKKARACRHALQE